jgi:hypothetical protein
MFSIAELRVKATALDDLAILGIEAAGEGRRQLLAGTAHHHLLILRGLQLIGLVLRGEGLRVQRTSQRILGHAIIGLGLSELRGHHHSTNRLLPW